MSDRVERLSGVAGVLAVVLWVVGVAAIGGGHVGIPGGIPEEGADEVLAHFRDNADAVVSGSWLFMLGSLAFLRSREYSEVDSHAPKEVREPSPRSPSLAGSPPGCSRSAFPPAASWRLSVWITSEHRRRRR